jgi:hypothetical protein
MASAVGALIGKLTGAGRSLLLAGVMLGSVFSLASSASAETAMQAYVTAMQPGTNWGNTLDAVPNEFSWGAPATTQAMIQGLAAKGYKSLRLPVTWSNYMGPAPDYTIDPVWMDHVQQIVDWALAANLHVMLNAHHDSWTWFNKMGYDHDAKLDQFQKVWLQIATRFKDYPRELSFESINEPGFRDANDHDLPADQMRALLDEVNTTFFNVVRGTGGNNATRPLVLPSVYTSADQPMIDSLKATITHLNDPNLIATVHYYGYYPFSVNMGGETKFGDLEKYWVDVPFNAVHDTFVASGIPVIIGEWGVLSGNNIERGEMLKYHEYVAQYARQKNITTMLWDTGGVYNRTTQDWQPSNADLAAIIRQGEVGRATTSESDLLFIKAGTPVTDTLVNLHLNGNTLVSIDDNGTTLTPEVDYTISGDVLTLKAPVLAKYATGAFGQKATLTLNSNVGPAWKIYVRYADTPVPAAFTALNGAGLSIPVAFNGDVLATIECHYADGTNAGPVGWSAFPFWGSDFHPDYANNAIVLSSGFFSGAPANSIVNFAFHFWSGKVLAYQVQIKPRTGSGGPDYVIAGEGLASGWNDWTSWTAHNLNDTAQAHSGSKSFSITFGTWGGVALQHNSWEPTINTSGFHTLVFWIHGGTAGGQKIGIGPIRGSTWGPGSMQVPVPVANTWQKVEIPLSSLGVDGSPNITGFYFQDWSGGSQPTVYIDDLTLSTSYASTAREITGTPAPVITSTTVASGQYNAPFSYTVTAVDNPVSFGANGLPAGLAIDAGTGVISGTPLAAGSFSVTLSATNAVGTNTETLALTIAPAPATVALSGLTFTYDGAAKSATVTTSPADLPVTVTYNGGPDAPVNAGSYAVVATLADPNYAAAPASGTLVIQQAAATITLPGGSTPFSAAINAAYDGTAQTVSLTTSPTGVPVTVTYNGSTTAPTLPGTYHVVVTSSDANYTGSVEGTFVITVTALVRHAPTLNGDLGGSLQLLTGESFAVNGSASVVDDLLLPGTPTVRLNGHPSFGGVVDAAGAVAPTDYSVTLNGGALVGHVVRRVDPITLPAVTAPAKPIGTREVTLNHAQQSPGDFATIRNLTLNGNAGTVAVPAGVYGSFTVNGNSSLVLGVEGATEPAAYEFQSLTLNGNTSVQVVGPVTLKLADGITLNGVLGAAEHPEWLEVQIAKGGLTLNGNATLHGIVTAPNSAVTVSGVLHGRVSADKLTLNGNGVLADPDL